MKIGFTGHRDKLADPFDIEEIEKMYPGATWVHGGAKGFDTQVHQVAIGMGKSAEAGTIIVLRPDYATYGSSYAPLERNKRIVAQSDMLYACHDGRKDGGTVATMGYAIAQDVPIVRLIPSGQDVNFASGGRNPHVQKTCQFCRYLEHGENRSGGWCKHPRNRVEPSSGWPNGFAPSVASSGGCDLWKKL